MALPNSEERSPPGAVENVLSETNIEIRPVRDGDDGAICAPFRVTS